MKYVAPFAEIVAVEAVNVLLTSGGTGCGGLVTGVGGDCTED